MIYAITEIEHRDSVKIGFTEDLESMKVRLSRHQVGNPRLLALVAWDVGDLEREGVLHALFHEHWLRGEWFSNVGIVAKFVDEYAIDPLHVRSRWPTVVTLSEPLIAADKSRLRENERRQARDVIQKLTGELGKKRGVGRPLKVGVCSVCSGVGHNRRGCPLQKEAREIAANAMSIA